MSAAAAGAGEAIMGYDAIARAAGKATNQSVSKRTAQRWAAQGRTNRLPVYVYPNGRAYVLTADLALWARAWLALRPSGGREAGTRAA